MIELTVLNFLVKGLEVPVHMGYEPGEEKEFVTVEKTNSGVNNHINYARFAIQSYSDTLYHAAVLNKKVKYIMNKMSETENIGKVKLNSDYNFTDSTTKKYRYQAVYDIWY